ncbi:MAG: hypothetical protein AABW54_00555 [Candidatus Micrarchaeota archaeon]
MATVSAPGKILWIGGYSVLERPNESHVTGINKRVTAKVEKLAGGRVELSCPQFGVALAGKIKDGKISFEGADAKQVEAAKFVRKAVEVSCAVLSARGVNVDGVRVETESDDAFGFGGSKSGLGSSAAVSVAAVGAVFEAHGMKVATERELVHKTSQMVHSLVQGKVGSGFDVAAACFGGCKYVRYSPGIVKGVLESSAEKIVGAINANWDCSITPVPLPRELHVAMASFDGESASTSAMVKKVNAWKAAAPGEYSQLMARLNEANAAAISALDEGKLDEFKKHFTLGRTITKELGVKSGAPIETDDCTKLIEESERHGAFCCKLPGAGGGDAIAALCRSREDKLRLEAFWRKYPAKKLRVLGVGASNEGVRAE